MMLLMYYHPVYLSSHYALFFVLCFFLFNTPATTELYTLSLHDALPILPQSAMLSASFAEPPRILGDLDRLLAADIDEVAEDPDRKSTRLNSSHLVISYAVFCLKKKKQKNDTIHDK